MDLGPLVGTYDSALSSIVKMKRADVNSKNFPLFEGKKGPLPPASVLCWTPAVRKQYPLPAPTNSFLKMLFFSLLSLSPSCYNVFSIFNPQPSKLPSSLQTRSDEWSFKNQNLNARLLQFVIICPAPTFQKWTKLCKYSSTDFVSHYLRFISQTVFALEFISYLNTD